MDLDLAIYLGSTVAAFVGGFFSAKYRRKPSVIRMYENPVISESSINAIRQQVAIATINGQVEPNLSLLLTQFLDKIDQERTEAWGTAGDSVEVVQS